MASPGNFKRQKEDEHSRRPYIWKNDNWMVAVSRNQLSDEKWSADAWLGNRAPETIIRTNNKEEARKAAVEYMEKRSN
jgi:hypothetical protein